jgi:RNA-directed DNA polymerase
VSIDEGFDFLGWNFRKYSGTLLIKPSRKNAQAFYRKVKEVISANKTVKQEVIIRLLNPMLRGWAQYHSPVVAKEAFSKMQSRVFRALLGGQNGDTEEERRMGAEEILRFVW